MDLQMLGLDVFDSLRAEEEEWLSQVFVPPPEFELMSSARSIVVFGGSGSGKTAAYLALRHNSLNQVGKSQRLLVEWYPIPLQSELEGDSQSVWEQLTQIFDACAMTLLTYLVEQPALFEQAPTWAQNFIVWFIRQYVQGDIETRTGFLTSTISQAGQTLLKHLVTSPVRIVFSAPTAPEIIITELPKVLQTIQLQGAWIMVDGLESWNDAEPKGLANSLRVFLSTLNLFERQGFIYKMFLPIELERLLAGTGGIARRRVDAYRLNWSQFELIELVERRLVVASGGKLETLADLCEDIGLPKWLEKCGANSPRGWLQQIRPLVAAYLDQVRRTGKFEPISAKTWKKIRRRHPPSLTLDEANRRVTVGWREVKDLPEGPYKLLQYLYRHPGQVCSKSALYYRAYLGMEHEPLIPSDPGWEAPKNIEGMIDTAIWRLRQAIEPGVEAGDYLFVVTVRGQGVRLENAL